MVALVRNFNSLLHFSVTINISYKAKRVILLSNNHLNDGGLLHSQTGGIEMRQKLVA